MTDDRVTQAFQTRPHETFGDWMTRIEAAIVTVQIEQKAEIERLRTALEEVRRYTVAVVGAAEAYNETESAHLWQEVTDIADGALYPPVESPT